MTLAVDMKTSKVPIEVTNWKSADLFLSALDDVQRKYYQEVLDDAMKTYLDEIRVSSEYSALSISEKIGVEHHNQYY